jgi:hypothetical protein
VTCMTDCAGWTYGAELEWPDVDVRRNLDELDAGWAWSRTDYTVVNSDGVANDPLHELVLRGGELNTPVCSDPEELAMRAESMAVALTPGHNYRSNLHIHLGVPELQDLDAVKRVADYSWRLLPGALKMSDPLNGLFTGLTDAEEVAGAKARMRHSGKSRHHFVGAARHELRMEAGTLEEFLAAGGPKTRDGRFLWHLDPREAVNLRSLKKHGTVEFRCFAGDREAKHVWAAASFARDWLRAALNGDEVFEADYFFDLPQQSPFELRLERGWEWTNFSKNKRGVVRERLAEMGKLPCE